MGKLNAVSTADEQEIAEARGSTLPDMLYDVVARAATSSIGQFVYKRIDNLLWTVEKTARWSLPQPAPMVSEKTAICKPTTAGTEESEEVGTNISGPPLIRPLPWLLFLPALIVLRLIRTALSMAARLVGRGPVLPTTMVSFLQNKRRKLRALKYRGQRLQRIARIETAPDGEQAQATAASWLQRIILPLKMVICTGPYRATDLSSDVAHAVVFRKDRPTMHKRGTAVSKKRNLNQREAESAEEEASDEDSFEDAGCKELLEKYANMGEDSSFNVDDISSASDDSSCSQSDADPSPKKPNIDTNKQQPNGDEQKQREPAEPVPKAGHLKRSASEHKNGIDASQPTPTKGSNAAKSINTANRSKSAVELEKGSNMKLGEASGADSSSSNANSGASSSSSSNTTTPSKGFANLTSSPENNENKPINDNIPGAAAIPIKSPSTAVQKPLTKPSPTMSDVRSNFHQQKQPTTGGRPAAPQQQQLQQQQQQQHQHQQTHQQQHMSNGGKNRVKKPSTQSAA